MSNFTRTACFLVPMGLALTAGGAEPTQDAPTEGVHVCYPGEDGQLTGQIVEMPIEPGFLEIQQQNHKARGAGDNRLDLVFVGDGYTAGQMGTYHAHANTVATQFFAYEPYTSYEPYFRITTVDVVSNESGVSNDPSNGISRDTALDMAYWCGGIERLLCVNVSAAYSHANAGAADVDQVLAIANSSKYGGAGYPSSNLGTLAGGNSSSVDVAIHENGHSLGDLADEYTYGGSTTYSGGEPSDANASKLTETQQIAQGRKWYRWMDESMAGFDGTVGTFEGAVYSVNGVYRPSGNSMMRNLGRPFNLVSAEKLIREIYREVSPIDDSTPSGVVDAGDTLFVTPMQPNGHSLDIVWEIDGQISVPLAGHESVAISSLGLDAGDHTIDLTVVDNTPWVRDPAIRDQYLTATRSYSVTISGCDSGADLNGDGVLDVFDVFAYLDAFNDGNLSVADLTGDGSLDVFDVFAFLDLFNAGCP